MKTYTSLITLLFFSLFGYSQYTAIPDPNFENALSAYDNIPNDGQVPTINISSLTSLDVSNQNITDLTGIEDFATLQTLNCSNNQLTNLDVSQNIALQTLFCNNNQLVSLNVNNGNNTNISTSNFNSSTNNDLTCIEVDDVAYSTTNWTQIDPASSFSLNCHYGETYVPDDNFENYLETHDANGNAVAIGDPTSMGNGIANDDYVTTSHIDTVQSLIVSNLSISDMTGIQDFTLLKYLICEQNTIAILDVSNNVYLEALLCGNNNLNALNVTQNSNLITLWCYQNNLTALDVSANILLDQLLCNNNQITNLDLTNNSVLTTFNCHTNSLTSLDISNGNNLNVTQFISSSNPNLTCINVDDPLYSTANWPNKDTWASYSNNCPSTCSYPTNLSATIPTISGATLAWQENGVATVWDLKIGLQGFNPNFMPPTHENVSNPYIWTGGMPNTSYDFYVRADCSGNNTVTSAWEGPFTFSTIAFCESGDFTIDNTTPFNGVMNSTIAFADVDGDNDQDILITGLTVSNQEITELYINNAGVFTLATGTPFIGVYQSSVAFADVDNDGDQDVVISGITTGLTSIKLYLNNGSGNFFLDTINNFTPNSFASIAFADVDSNGFQDLVITGYGSTSLYKNTAGTFTLDTTTPFQALGKSSTDFADVDGDGDQDLLISGENAGYHTKLYLNNGFGNFTLSSQSFQGVFRGDNEFADIDNDGDLDVLITGYGNGGTYYSNLYKNNGLGAFSLIAAPFDPMFASSVAFGDIDNDGDKDIIMSGFATNRITKLYNNDGTGTFTEILGTPFDGTDSGSLAFADIDNDFDLDVLITGQNPSSTRIAKLYLNNTYYNTNYTTTGWTNGIPDINKCAVIDDDLSITNFSARKLTVNATLTVTANSYIEIKKDIINNAMLRVEPTGSVVQIDNNATVTGSGTFQTQIQTTPLQDDTRYTYFSSPSASETVNTFSSWANTGSMWSYDETNQAWVHITNNTTPMNPGDGYIIRGNSSISYPTSPITEFANAYNNGIITQSLNFKGDGGATLNIDNDSNLVGNPYPSAIDGTKLLNVTLNPTAGTLYFWTHNSSPVNGNFSTDDYALWNLSGGTAAISGGTAPTGFIASGQGFFIDAEGDETLALGTNVTSTLTFNNEMRVTGNNTDFRQSDSNTHDKIWLDLTNAQGVFNQTLIAFLPNATNQFDRAYDGKRISNGIATIYSMQQNGQQLGIQALPTLQSDTVVPLGYTVENTTINQLKIGINHIENMQGFTVYLKDNLLNTIHNLSDSDYNFTVATTGVFNHRFELLFRTSALSETDYTLNENLIVSNQNNTILVKTTNGSIINKLEVYNLLGKQILKTKVQNVTYSIDANNINQGTILFIKATLENGTVLNKKNIKL